MGPLWTWSWGGDNTLTAGGQSKRFNSHDAQRALPTGEDGSDAASLWAITAANRLVRVDDTRAYEIPPRHRSSIIDPPSHTLPPRGRGAGGAAAGGRRGRYSQPPPFALVPS